MKIPGIVTSPSVIVVTPMAVSTGQRLGVAVACAAADASKASVSIAETFESRTHTLMQASKVRPIAAETSPIVPSAPSCVMP